MKNNFASPGTGSLTTNIENVVNGIGCQTVKSNGGIGNKSFNLKIKVTNESSSKRLKLSTNKKVQNLGIGTVPSIMRSNTKDEVLN